MKIGVENFIPMQKKILRTSVTESRNKRTMILLLTTASFGFPFNRSFDVKVFSGIPNMSLGEIKRKIFLPMLRATSKSSWRFFCGVLESRVA